MEDMKKKRRLCGGKRRPLRTKKEAYTGTRGKGEGVAGEKGEAELSR